MTARGRPSSYSQETADKICSGLADGRSLRSICLDSDMPDQTTVFRWLRDEGREDFRQQYARAREDQADAIFDEMLDIADDGSNDYVQRERPDGSTYDAFDAEHVQRSKLRIEARKWMAGKLRPKVYGEKLDIQHDVTPGAATLIAAGMTAKQASEAWRDELSN